MTAISVRAESESWPLKQPFVIARGAKSEAEVLVVTISDGTNTGRGESVPYPRYRDDMEGAQKAASTFKSGTIAALTAYITGLPAGAARNALDCALWDYRAKKSGTRAAKTAGVDVSAPVATAYTISLADPDKMAGDAGRATAMPLLKLKLCGDDVDADRMRAVRAARPDARLIADANESWPVQSVEALLAIAAELNFEMVEQPLPADSDAALASLVRPIPVCADESCHTARDVARLTGLYDAVNIKLDKTGGLTAAFELLNDAREAQFKIMIGSMVATSLAAAPALLLAPGADWVDLDGPLLLARDRDPGLHIENGMISPADPSLWG